MGLIITLIVINSDEGEDKVDEYGCCCGHGNIICDLGGGWMDG